MPGIRNKLRAIFVKVFRFFGMKNENQMKILPFANNLFVFFTFHLFILLKLLTMRLKVFFFLAFFSDFETSLGFLASIAIFNSIHYHLT